MLYALSAYEVGIDPENLTSVAALQELAVGWMDMAYDDVNHVKPKAHIKVVVLAPFESTLSDPSTTKMRSLILLTTLVLY